MSIGNTLAIVQKELRSYFTSPIAYVVTAAFLVVGGFFFWLSVSFAREATLRGLLSPLAIVLLIVTPTLTMRLLAEEARTGTIELLLTSPLRDAEIVIGKYLGALIFLAFMLALTAYYPLLLFSYGQPDIGPILGGYLGLLLLGATFLAIGLLASSVTQNQIVAAVLSFSALLVLWLMGAVPQALTGPVGSVLGYLGLSDHFNDFIQGIIDTKNVVYYLAVVLGAIFLTIRSLESRRWR